MVHNLLDILVLLSRLLPAPVLKQHLTIICQVSKADYETYHLMLIKCVIAFILVKVLINRIQTGGPGGPGGPCVDKISEMDY